MKANRGVVGQLHIVLTSVLIKGDWSGPRSLPSGRGAMEQDAVEGPNSWSKLSGEEISPAGNPTSRLSHCIDNTQ